MSSLGIGLTARDRTDSTLLRSSRERLARATTEREYRRLERAVLGAVRRKLDARNIALDDSDLEEAYCLAWHAVYKRLCDGRPVDRLLPLLVTVTFRRAIDEYRSLHPGLRHDDPAAIEPVADPVDLHEHVADRLRLDRLIVRLRTVLTPRERAAVVLCLLHGHSRADAAAALRLSVTRVNKLMDSAHLKIADVVAVIDARGCGEQEWARLLWAYALARPSLTLRDQERAEAHIEHCAVCRRYVLCLRGLAAVVPPVLLPLPRGGLRGRGGSEGRGERWGPGRRGSWGRMERRGVGGRGGVHRFFKVRIARARVRVRDSSAGEHTHGGSRLGGSAGAAGAGGGAASGGGVVVGASGAAGAGGAAAGGGMAVSGGGALGVGALAKGAAVLVLVAAGATVAGGLVGGHRRGGVRQLPAAPACARSCVRAGGAFASEALVSAPGAPVPGLDGSSPSERASEGALRPARAVHGRPAGSGRPTAAGLAGVALRVPGAAASAASSAVRGEFRFEREVPFASAHVRARDSLAGNVGGASGAGADARGTAGQGVREGTPPSAHAGEFGVETG